MGASRLLVAGSVFATWTIWGSTYLAIRYALRSFPPFLQMGSRFVIAGVLLLAWAKWRGAAWPVVRQWRNAAVVGSLMVGAGMGLTAYAEQTIESSIAVVFVAAMPMLLILLSRLFGVRADRLELAGVGVGFLGIVQLVRGESFAASPWGLAAMTCAVTGWATGSVLSQHRLPLAPGAMGYASQMLCGGGALCLVSAALGERLQWPPQPEALAAWIYLIVAGSLIAFNAYMFLLKHVRPSTASSYTLVNPIVGLFLGATLAGERLSAREWAASGIILAGVSLLLLGAFRRSRRA